MLQAQIHSIETCGTVDGPGIRYVTFFRGCPLRCLYCHNPDTWCATGDELKTVEELIADVRKYKSYMRFSGGGFTASGGEPLLQHEFILELFKALRKEGVHTAIDTSGFGHGGVDRIAELLDYTDLVLLDIKSIVPNTFKAITSVDIDQTLELADYLNRRHKPIWARHVVVPQLTDNPDDLKLLAEYLSGLNNLEKVELLPFHKMGEFKWEMLQMDYALKDTQAPSKESMNAAKAIFANHRLPIA